MNCDWLPLYCDISLIHILQVSPGEVADNVPHSAQFIFNTEMDKIQVFFDGERREAADIPLKGALPSEILRDSTLYLGGVPDYNAIPWHIYSRSGFLGCVEEVQVSCRLLPFLLILTTGNPVK